MPSLDKHDSPLPTTTVKWRFPSVHPEGRKYAVAVGGAALLAYVVHWQLVGWVLAGLTLWVVSFFRDPVRTTPRGSNLVIAPADGLITMIVKVPPPPELRGADGLSDPDYTRVSIFMSVFDVHINRAPIAGRVRRIAYVPGKFINADLDKASEDNERQHLLIEGSDGLKIGFTQIAGLVARRIIAFVREGDVVVAGQRVGLIRFGSRVDVFLPAGVAPRVLLVPRAIVLAGVLDGLDGRIARLLRAQSKFGAELDSLSDNIAFGTAPALILFLWSLQTAPRFGWIAALALAVCCALRLARFNARLDAAEQPHKSANFNTGVPAPAGAGLAFVPIYLWLITHNGLFREWQLVMAWTILIALLMISSIPTYSWASIRIRREWRMFALAGIA